MVASIVVKENLGVDVKRNMMGVTKEKIYIGKHNIDELDMVSKNISLLDHKLKVRLKGNKETGHWT